MTVQLEDAPAISYRSNFVFSENGRYATSLRTRDEDVVLESWTLLSEEARVRTVPDLPIDRGTLALSYDDGRILLFRSGGTAASHRRELALLQPLGDECALHHLGEVPARFGGYLLPTAVDAPEIEAIIVEHPSVEGPRGMKGVGEPPVTTPGGAIGNAIFDAVGAVPHETPMTPERVWRAIGSLRR